MEVGNAVNVCCKLSQPKQTHQWKDVASVILEYSLGVFVLLALCMIGDQ